MKINIKATGIELTPAISDYVDRKISALGKILSDNPDIVAQVEVGKTTSHHKGGEIFKAEVHLIGGGLDQYALAESEDLYAAIDKVKDEITSEVKRGKGKRFALAKRGGEAIKKMMKGILRRGGRNVSPEDEL